MKPKETKSELTYHAFAIVRGDTPINFRLIKIRLRGKFVEQIEVVSDDILPIVGAMADQLLRQEVLN